MNHQYPVYGIDLGTSNSCISVYYNGHVEPVFLEGVNETVPSYITYTSPTEYVCGTASKNNLTTFPTSTISFNKRIKGQHFNDCRAFIEQMGYPFDVLCNNFGDPIYRLTVGNTVIEKTPVEVDTDYMRWMIRSAEQKTGIPCQYIVITCPAYFTERQKEATMIAANNISPDIKLLNLLPEPVSAAMATNPDPALEKRFILVYDFGGGTFDVAIMENQLNSFSIIQNLGKADLGGCDIDYLLYRTVLEYIRGNYEDNEKIRNTRNLRRLRNACEDAKIRLSSYNEVEIDLRFLDIDDEYVITRPTFEMLIEPFIRESIECCQEALRVAQVTLTPQDRIILVGGTSRIPVIQQQLSKYFQVDVYNNINPNNIVSFGATYSGITNYCDRINKEVPLPFERKGIQLMVLRDLGISFDKYGKEINLILPAGTRSNEEKTVDLPGVFGNTKIYVFTRDKASQPWKMVGFLRVSGLHQKKVTMYMDTYGSLYCKYRDFMNHDKMGKIECFSHFSEEEAAEMQRRKLAADDCIKYLKNYKNYFNNHPNRDYFNKVCDDAINQFFATDMVFDIDKKEITDYLTRICRYIVNNWK